MINSSRFVLVEKKVRDAGFSQAVGEREGLMSLNRRAEVPSRVGGRFKPVNVGVPSLDEGETFRFLALVEKACDVYILQGSKAGGMKTRRPQDLS